MKKKPYDVLHIEVTIDDQLRGKKQKDWMYKLVCKSHTILKPHRVGKLYRSRSAAARAANKIAKRIIHWYPI